LQDWLGDDMAKRHRREVHFPTGRFGEAIEQAHAVVFLASDESSFVNGTDFVVDGGMTKVYPPRSPLRYCSSRKWQSVPRWLVKN
jgi:NAD(P)-dependent dehydrogenase (short-subunit alcohol dehydrogenase family)